VCSGKPQPDLALLQPALPVLARLLHMADEDVLADSCWALSHVAGDISPQNLYIQSVIDSGVTGRLVELLSHQSAGVQMPALQAVGNLVTGDDAQTQAVLDCGVLPCLLALLAHPQMSLRADACWAISSITAGTHAQIAAVIHAGIIPLLVAALQHGHVDVQKEAVRALRNAALFGTEQQLRFLAEQQCVLPSLCALLACPNSEVIVWVLQCMERILCVAHAAGEWQHFDSVRRCGGIRQLQCLEQQHEEPSIRLQAQRVLTTHCAPSTARRAYQRAGQVGHSILALFITSLARNFVALVASKADGGQPSARGGKRAEPRQSTGSAPLAHTPCHVCVDPFQRLPAIQQLCGCTRVSWPTPLCVLLLRVRGTRWPSAVRSSAPLPRKTKCTRSEQPHSDSDKLDR